MNQHNHEQWTFSDLDIEWVHDIYNTKEKAIEAAKETYDIGCYVGRIEYKRRKHIVKNIEKILFDDEGVEDNERD